MALPVRPRLGIKGSIRQTCVLTAFVSGRVFYFFFIWLKYNFYLTSFRMTVPQNRGTPRDIHYFLWSCLGSPSTFHLPSSLIYFTLSESLMCFFLSTSPSCPPHRLYPSSLSSAIFSLPYFAMTFPLRLLG